MIHRTRVLPQRLDQSVSCSKARPPHPHRRSMISSRNISAYLCLSVASLCFVSGSSALAQQVTVVRAARVLDVAKGEIISPAVVVVANGKIQSIGGNVPSNARTLDLGDLTLLPGLI